MKFEEAKTQSETSISAYGNGGFRIGEDLRVEGSVLLTPQGYYPWDVTSKEQMSTESFARIIEMSEDLELLILGMGENMAFLKRDLRSHLESHDIGVEVMATGAAARTYNVLLLEGRRVAAALIAV
ncbi:Mth938-like domain-containing protein [Emcibacter sp.]|uniref:Mth938-like domain-containing protein n=1 Tax=Emcibacter sp. TaxID=1979954 RepID=UPI002AA798A5|nr:MTH938/NDUFAF3 family protein [Emcibacter sp.]